MQTDFYTKVVLTVIATMLVVLVAQNSIEAANAQQGPMRVIICSAGSNTSDCAGVRNGYLAVRDISN